MSRSNKKRTKKSQLSQESSIIATVETIDESKIEDIALRKILEDRRFEYYYTEDKQWTIMEFDDGSHCQMSTHRFFLFMNVIKNLLGLNSGTKKQTPEPEFID
jgi:hypothetical protein